MARLLIDGTSIQPNAKGVGRYAYNVCLGLAGLLPADWVIQILIHRENLDFFPGNSRVEMAPIQASSEIHQALLELPRQAARLKPDLMLKIYESAGYVKGLPTVTVCHDIDELIWAAQGGSWNPVRQAINHYKRSLRRKLLRSSDFVVCNSEFIRQSVQTYYGIAAEKTRVAYCAVDPRFYEYSRKADLPAIRAKYNVKNFILTFATGDRRENFACYPMLAAKMVELGVNTCLLVAGMALESSYAEALRQQFLAAGLVEGRHFLFEEFLGENRFVDLAGLYTAADFYLELSLHEGFGMQLVEAMACGTTCISSPRGALAEIGSQYALFADPMNSDEVAAVIKQAYAQNLDLRDNSEQIRYTRKFCWSDTTAVIGQTLLQLAAMRG